MASWRIALPHTTAAVPIARALIRKALAHGGGGESGSEGEGGGAYGARGGGTPGGAIRTGTDSHTAELLTAELVANAVEHTAGRTPIELVVELRPTGCQVEVHDADPSPVEGLDPRAPLPRPDPYAENGRGLLLIRTLSSASGCRVTDRGKATWFTLAPGRARS
ncbi:ATP-binding protein [Streptomyces sp. MST-110588]|uniref:ATP-binding protein n=1 Tax=Streptomyces sp. MST-110588 TaxID=2833628 RepID=UPI001F5C9302|nr:ATP-binding protein [Streptomyces sp. MST-110588]UNO39491.1 ATP-binding protein [Streptomyces sp. MST-110588]